MHPMVMPIIAYEYDKTLAGGAETEGGRRPTVVSTPPAASPELTDRPRRRTFKAADKLRILRQVDEAQPVSDISILTGKITLGPTTIFSAPPTSVIVAATPVKPISPRPGSGPMVRRRG